MEESGRRIAGHGQTGFPALKIAAHGPPPLLHFRLPGLYHWKCC